jgi:hypothetical protein
MDFAARSVLLWHQTNPGREVTSEFECADVDDGRDHCGGRNHADAGNGCQPKFMECVWFVAHWDFVVARQSGDFGLV